MNKIIINRGSFRLDEVVFQQGTTTIGRASDNTITLDDTAVSSHHAKIVTLFHTSYIEDLDSTNGTLVNGKSVQKRTLHSGDVVSLGNHQLLFQSDNDTHKSSDTSETLLLKGSEIKERLSEFMQAQSQMEKRNAKHATEASQTIVAEDANTPAHSVSSIDASKDTSSDKANGASDRQIPPAFGINSANSPSLDKEKNRAWLEAKKPPIPAQKPAPVTEPKFQAETATDSNPSTPSMRVEPSQPSPQTMHNTAAAIRASSKTPAVMPASDTVTDSLSDDTLNKDTSDHATGDAANPSASNIDDNSNDATIATTIKPIVHPDKTTVDIAAAARAATQRHRGNNIGGYASTGAIALNRSKPRSKLLPMIWMLIVAVLIGEVVYITYRSMG